MLRFHQFKNIFQNNQFHPGDLPDDADKSNSHSIIYVANGLNKITSFYLTTTRNKM